MNPSVSVTTDMEAPSISRRRNAKLISPEINNYINEATTRPGGGGFKIPLLCPVKVWCGQSLQLDRSWTALICNWMLVPSRIRSLQKPRRLFKGKEAASTLHSLLPHTQIKSNRTLTSEEFIINNMVKFLYQLWSSLGTDAQGCTRSPCVHRTPWRAQYDRRNFLKDTGGVHRNG